MRFYHRTRQESAEAILREGFRDGAGHYGTALWCRGVWISNTPWDAERGREALFEVRVPIRVVRKYEWVEEGKGQREWLVPARTLNRHAQVRLLSPLEEDQRDRRRWARRTAKEEST